MARGDVTRLAILTLLLVLVPFALLVQAKKAHGPKKLVLYAHESDIGPDATLIVSADPGPNPNGSDTFGLIRSVSNVLRDGTAKNATILGSQVGLVVVGLDGANIYLSFTYFLNANATYQGTIAVHGHIDGFSTVERQFAVVGGTGHFLSVTGVDKSPFDSANPPDPTNVINVHTLTLTYRD